MIQKDKISIFLLPAGIRYKYVDVFSNDKVNIFVWINGIYVLLTVIKPTWICNQLYLYAFKMI